MGEASQPDSGDDAIRQTRVLAARGAILATLCAVRSLCRTVVDEVRQRWPLFILLSVIMVAGFVYLLPRDDKLLAQVIKLTNTEVRGMFGQNDQGIPRVRRTDIKKFARALYFWGDYLTGTLLVAGALAFMGLALKRPRWQAAALAVVLAAASAGLTANFFRLTTGRPRPVFTNVPDGFYGIRFEARYHAFPSGHSATAAATATVVVFTLPVAGVPVAAAALTVMWSRLYLRAHRPADVWVGGMIGVIFGTAFGLGVRRLTARSRVLGKNFLTV